VPRLRTEGLAAWSREGLAAWRCCEEVAAWHSAAASVAAAAAAIAASAAPAGVLSKRCRRGIERRLS
jgi:hypothetical protein